MEIEVKVFFKGGNEPQFIKKSEFLYCKDTLDVLLNVLANVSRYKHKFISHYWVYYKGKYNQQLSKKLSRQRTGV